MRRLPALLVLVLIAAFWGLAAWDDCLIGEEDCPPACHLGCADGCGVVTPPDSELGTASLLVLEALANQIATPSSLAAPLPELSPPRTS